MSHPPPTELVVDIGPDDLVGPTDDELAAIEDEWPVIEAELALVSAECAHALRPSPLTVRRVRVASDRLTSALLAACERASSTYPVRHQRGA